VKPKEGVAASRRDTVLEGLVVIGLALAAILWIIPAQTTSGAVLGLAPAFMPKVAATTIAVLAAGGLVLRLVRPEALAPGRRAPLGPAILVGGLTMLGVLALQFLGPIAAGLVMVMLGVPALGERRPGVLVTAFAVTAAALLLTFRPWL
jgi:hypothetical protein